MKVKTLPLTPAEKDLHESALRAANSYRAAQIELLSLIAKVDGTRLFEKLGHRSTFEYCVRALSLSEDLACAYIGVARKSREVPALMEAVREGLAISKAKKILPVLNHESAREWLTQAKHLTYQELERAVAGENPRAASPDKAKPISATHCKLEMSVTNETLEIFRRAQDLLSTKLGRAATLGETLQALAGEYVSRHDPVEKASRARKPDHPLHVVRRRDQERCQTFHGNGEQCSERRWLQVHHLRPKNEGGLDTPDNLVTLCAAHHRMFHRADGIVHRSADHRARGG